MNFLSEIFKLINKENTDKQNHLFWMNFKVSQVQRDKIVLRVWKGNQQICLCLICVANKWCCAPFIKHKDGYNWKLLHVDVHKNIWTYCDTLGSEIPLDLKFNVMPVRQKNREQKGNLLEPQNIIRNAHQGGKKGGTINLCHTFWLQNYALVPTSNKSITKKLLLKAES